MIDAKAVSAQFIRIRKGISSDPDVLQISMMTGLDEFGVVGRLSDIWDWVDSHSTDGIGLTASDAWIDRRVGCDGFAAAMRAVNWLSGESGCLTFPQWDRHNSNTAKARALESEAKRLRRAEASQTNVGQASDVLPAKMSDQSKSKSKSKNSNKHTPREAAPDFVELDQPNELAPDGRSWVHVEADFLTVWNSLPTGKRGVVPVTGLPPLMSVKDRDALRRVWPAKETSARKAMNRIADGSAFGWDRNPLTIQQFFEEIDNILGGKHERFTDSTSGRHSARTRGGRVDSSSDIDELLARPVDDRRTLAVSTGT